MNFTNIKKIARLEWSDAFRNPATLLMAAILGATLLAATLVGWQNFSRLNDQREQYRQVVSDKWNAQPDRHPHRVAHYGYLAFRPKAELSFFDFGIDSFAGVSIFLEAHRQNTVNFSEAGFSGGMMRFGELSPAMVLQLFVPLLIFFLGFAAVTAERENGTLPILLCQGASWQDILLGKTLGIVAVVFALLAPLVGLMLLLWAILSGWHIRGDALARVAVLIAGYGVYCAVCAFAAVLVSAFSRTSRAALTTLVLVWILLGIVMPKATQTAGAKLFPSPSKAEFDAALHAETSRAGDSHNPDDEHFKEFRAEVLRRYNVGDIKDLPVNYSGLVMTEGERISSQIFRNHYEDLIATFERQNLATEFASYVNPYLAIRGVSMVMAGSDFAHYADFQRQAEEYRYNLAQKMNDLHTHEIKRENDRDQKVSRENWQRQPPFVYQPKTFGWAIERRIFAAASIVFWLAAGIFAVFFASRKMSAI